MKDWTRGDYLQLMGIIVGIVVAYSIYLLQKRLSDKQKIEHRLDVEAKVGSKLYDILYKDSNPKVQLYNSRLIGKKRFAANKRSLLWGYPYHVAELYAANFDGLEFVVGIEKWGKDKFYKVGLISYERVLGVRAEGDSSFNGMIFYVLPKFFQLDKYSIAYKKFRYYPVNPKYGNNIIKPLHFVIKDNLKKMFLRARYYLFYYWKHRMVKVK